MAQEEKQILLQDLSARLPYHPIIFGKHGIACNEGPLGTVTSSGIMLITAGGTHIHYFLEEIKPYLRPMSSMTEEEEEGFEELFPQYTISKERGTVYHSSRGDLNLEVIDWLNRHFFDYHGLIDKGLALEAPEGMYDIKSN